MITLRVQLTFGRTITIDNWTTPNFQAFLSEVERKRKNNELVTITNANGKEALAFPAQDVLLIQVFEKEVAPFAQVAGPVGQPS